jgi:hypothetical protein
VGTDAGSAEFYMAVSRASFVLNPFGEASALLTLVVWLNCLMFRESLPDGLCRIAGINKNGLLGSRSMEHAKMPKRGVGEKLMRMPLLYDRKAIAIRSFPTRTFSRY